MSFKAALACTIYPRHCVDEARAAHADVCSVIISQETTQICEIEITAAGDETDDEQMAREFLNYLLNLSVEHHLGLMEGRHGANEI